MRIAPHNFVLAAVLALLVALLVLGGPEAPIGREITRLLPALVPSDAQRIEVVAGDRRVTLVRADGEWRLQELHDFPADPPLVERVLQVLAELTTLDLLTDDAARHAEYGLDDAAQRLRVLGAGDTLLADLLVGRAPSGAAFVRRSGDDAVYGASVLPRTSTDVHGWQRTVAVLPIEPGLVLRLELSGPELGEAPIVLQRDARRHDRWLDAAGTEVSRSGADSLVDCLMKLYVDRVLAGDMGPDEGAALGLAPPRFTVRVTATGDGGEREVEARIGRTAQGGLAPAVGPAGPWVLGLREASVARILLHATPLRR